MIVYAISGLALVLGLILPLRWGVVGFLGAVAVLFLCLFGVSASSGFEGASWEESLILFEGSVASYIGFNLQITARAFALPLLVLAVVVVWRFKRLG
ncbi:MULTISPECIES: hypothetical protein [unclassified Ruegeria]|uniref:hypothetical protein n=1 Tax=unclassified Ruegeria TaxID=2625375 RepID=UPI001492045B|nr:MULTISPECIES: hypothetical protein [unclassified Ruegeria]NOD90583.1 hypothetical protein [Ruegeria sp. HKCCD4318]NOE15914.1 hypothetical protein [Ruegeria sp. HKCCD4318-2]NOG10806.1 hypothetical protein [Ruegeria sp. HKCCD4315]